MRIVNLNIMRSSMKPALYRDFFPMLTLVQKWIFNHETKQSSKLQSDPSSQSLINRRLKNKLVLHATVYLFVSHFTSSAVF